MNPEIVTRTCKKCLQTRALSEFPLKKNKSGTITPRHTCGDCHRQQVQKRSHDAYMKLRSSDPEKYRQRIEKNRQRHRERYQTHYKSAKLEYNKTRRPKQLVGAHIKVKHAIESGVLIRPTQCSQCSKEARVEAHHEDYSKPLEVRWLCRSCHSIVHRKYLIHDDSARN